MTLKSNFRENAHVQRLLSHSRKYLLLYEISWPRNASLSFGEGEQQCLPRKVLLGADNLPYGQIDCALKGHLPGKSCGFFSAKCWRLWLNLQSSPLLQVPLAKLKHMPDCLLSWRAWKQLNHVKQLLLSRKASGKWNMLNLLLQRHVLSCAIYLGSQTKCICTCGENIGLSM